MKNSALLVVGFAALVALLAAGLRPDAFFVGDPGIKLIAAENALAHPDRPLDIPLPVIGPETLPFVEPFFEVHVDHAHAVTGELFPLLSAPFITWFGIRGIYVLPAAGFLAILIGSAWLAVALDPGRNAALVVLITAVATPFLFYGLEFWEHAPAVALATLATALWITSFRRPLSAAAPIALVGGVMFGLAFLLRPETGWAALAVMASWLAVGERDGTSDVTSRVQSFALTGSLLLGVALALAPFEIYTLRHFDRVLPAHLGANAGLLQTGWFGERAHLVADWLLPSGWGRSGPLRPESIWTAAPVILLAAVPVNIDTPRRGRTFLTLATALTVALVLLTAPNDGGGQWTPRYLLFAFVPLAILAADVVEALPKRHVTMGMLIVLLLACVWIQRSGYRDLRGTKSTYGRVVDFVSREVAPNGVIVTDLWWLDQIAASATTHRRLVYVANATDGRGVMQRLSRAVVPIVIVIRSSSESPDTSAWRAETCYVEIKRDTMDVRGLVAITLHHRCPG